MNKDELETKLMAFAAEQNLNWKLLRANLMCENGDLTGIEDGKIRSRFEPAVYKALAYKIPNNRNSQIPTKYYPDIITDDQIRNCSTSWGIAQIMGYWFYLIGYATIDDMLKAWQDEGVQLDDWFKFILAYNNGNYIKAVRSENVKSMAYQYNGPNFAVNHYDTKLTKYMSLV